jgi:hypothetical protein
MVPAAVLGDGGSERFARRPPAVWSSTGSTAPLAEY